MSEEENILIPYLGGKNLKPNRIGLFATFLGFLSLFILVLSMFGEWWYSSDKNIINLVGEINGMPELNIIRSLLFSLVIICVVLLFMYSIFCLLCSNRFLSRNWPLITGFILIFFQLISIFIFLFLSPSSVIIMYSGLGFFILSMIPLVISLTHINEVLWSAKKEKQAVAMLKNGDVEEAKRIFKTIERIDLAVLLSDNFSREIEESVSLGEKYKNWEKARNLRKKKFKRMVPEIKLSNYVSTSDLFSKRKRSWISSILSIIALLIMIFALNSSSWFILEYNEEFEINGRSIEIDFRGEYGILKEKFTYLDPETDEIVTEKIDIPFTGPSYGAEKFSFYLMILPFLIFLVLYIFSTIFVGLKLFSNKLSLTLGKWTILILLALLIIFPISMYTELRVENIELPQMIQDGLINSGRVGLSYFLVIFCLFLQVSSVFLLKGLKGNSSKYLEAENYFYALNFEKAFDILEKMGLDKSKSQEIRIEINKTIQKPSKRNTQSDEIGGIEKSPSKTIEIQCPGCNFSFSINSNQKTIKCPKCKIEGEMDNI